MLAVSRARWVMLLFVLLSPGATLPVPLAAGPMFDRVPLGPVATLFDYACTGSGFSQIVTGVTSARCDVRFLPFGEGAVQGEITGGTRPGIFIEGEALVFDPFSEVSAQMVGRLDYQVAVEQLRAIPVQVALPVTLDITVAGLANATTGTSSAAAFARIRSSVLVTDDEAHAGLLGSSDDEFLETYSAAVFPGVVFDVQLVAGCFVIATGADPAPLCGALADPLFKFDQAAFDQLAAARGVPPFPLAEYYGFQFSPGLVPATPPGTPGPPIGVPAPATSLLALAGLSAIWLTGRRVRPRRWPHSSWPNRSRLWRPTPARESQS